MVVAVLGPSLTLSYPDVLVLLADGVVHVFREQLARHEHFPHGQASLYDKALVNPYKVLDPGEREEVVANCNLACRGTSGIDEKHVEQRGVQDNVAVVAYERVALAEVDGREVCVAAAACLAQQIL